MIDVIESYNIDKPDFKIIVKDMPPNMHVFRLPELFHMFAMVFGKLKDEKDVMMEKMRKERLSSSQKSDDEDTFTDKLEMFIGVLKQCIVESGEKCKLLNKLFDVLLKVKVSYVHY